MASEKVAHDSVHSDDNLKTVQAEHVDGLKIEALTNPDILNDAYDGENREHAQGMWDEVKAHPKACLWAFCMCFTIVSHPLEAIHCGPSYVR